MNVIVEFSDEDYAGSRARWESVRKILIAQYMKNLPITAIQKNSGEEKAMSERALCEKKRESER